MLIHKVLDEYLQLTKKEKFLKYEKELAYAIITGLNEKYKQGLDEQALVLELERILNNINGLSTSFNGFNLFTKSIFIHGNKFQVEFQYYGEKAQRELGDLIFILSIVYKGKKYFEKFTISQFKNDNNNSRWVLSNKKQLYLLSHFPSFKGISGSIIPSREFNLPDYSGCLGSYNFLYAPGDFIFVSARKLDNFLGTKNSISRTDLSKLWEPPSSDFIFPMYLYCPYIEDVYSALANNPRRMHYITGILGTARYASNVHDFVDLYMRGYIGELIFSETDVYNKPVLNFLHELLRSLKAKKSREHDVIEFVDNFFKYHYSDETIRRAEAVDDFYDNGDGGIGIIHTVIDLGEGRER